MQKLLALILGIFGFGFLFVSPTFASAGSISLPNELYNRNDPQYAGLLWNPGGYTASPYLDPSHYDTCSRGGNSLTGVLYNSTDNTAVQSGLISNIGCDGWMIFQTVTTFSNNTPYYFVITDPKTGQTWRSPCFEDTGDDAHLVGCPGNQLPSINPLANASVTQGGTYSASGSFSDSDSTSWTATVDYGDGVGAQPLALSGTNFSLSHQYNTQGTYTVTVSVADNQAATASATALIMVAGNGTITIPTVYYARNGSNPGLLWDPGVYTASPYLDPYHYRTCEKDPDGRTLNGVLYKDADNTVVASGLLSNVGCDGWMDFETLSPSTFQNNTPYHFIITDPHTGQTWRSPCFEDTGDDAHLSACASRQLTALSPATVWISKNLLDIGMKLDIKAEAYKDTTLVSSGQLNSVSVGTGGNPTSHTIPFNSFSPVDFPSGAQLKVQVYARNACSGSLLGFGTANLYYNSSAHDSRFGATVGTTSGTYHLLDGFLLGTSAGTSDKTVSVAAGAKCSPFKSFGTWTITP